MLKINIQPVTAFAQNCSLLICPDTRHAILVDPGGDPDILIELIKQNKCSLQSIVLTHGHLDHVGAAKVLASHFNVKVIGPHVDDKFWFDALPQQAQMFGFSAIEPFLPDTWLTHGDEILFGNEQLEVRHCPGHTPGHIVLIHHISQSIIVGDVLFKGSIGRTDFPKGDQVQLIHSIKTQIFTLADDFVVYPGHGPTTTIGVEKKTNPYVSGRFG